MIIGILLFIAGLLIRLNASDIDVNGASSVGLILLIFGAVLIIWNFILMLFAGAVISRSGKRF